MLDALGGAAEKKGTGSGQRLNVLREALSRRKRGLSLEESQGQREDEDEDKMNTSAVRYSGYFQTFQKRCVWSCAKDGRFTFARRWRRRI